MTFNERLDRFDEKLDAIIDGMAKASTRVAVVETRVSKLEQNGADMKAGRRHWGGLIVGALIALVVAGCSAGVTYVFGVG